MKNCNKVSTIEGLSLGYERRSGRTTRILDHAVQLLFQGFVIIVMDHHENGQHKNSNRDLAKRIFGRFGKDNTDRNVYH